MFAKAMGQLNDFHREHLGVALSSAEKIKADIQQAKSDQEYLTHRWWRKAKP